MTTTPEQDRAWRNRQRQGLPAGQVYRCYDTAGELIYIGSTSLPIAERIRLHQQKHNVVRRKGRTKAPHWSVLIGRIEVDAFESLDAAREAEQRQIAALHPRCNMVTPSGRHSRAQVDAYVLAALEAGAA